MAAIVKQYRPRVVVIEALVLPCYVAVTYTMTVQRALKQGAHWLVPRALLGTVARQEAGDKMSFINAALVSGFKGLKVTGSIQEALLQVTQDVFTPKIVKDYAKEAAKAATVEKHYSSQNNRLAAALTDTRDSLEQVKQDAAATADHFNNFQVEMSASLAQVQEKMNMQAEQLEAAELQLVQQQARLTSQEAELHESETAFQERMTAHSQMHSRLNGASSGRFSLAAGAANPAPVDILINPLWSLGSALPSSPLIQAVEDVLPGDLRLVTTPLGIPNTGCHALEPCKVQVITNDIFDMQPTAESQMCPVVHSAERHADFGAAPASPTFHSSSADFHTARSRLSHEFVPVASSSSSSSTSSWSPSSLDSLASIDQKVVSDRSASDRSERSCSGRQPSSVRMQHEVPSVSVVRPQVVFPTTAQQVAAHTGPAVKSASTAQKSSKRTATMSRRQVNLSPIPLNFSSADICSTSSGDCNRGTAKGGDVKGAPAYKTAGRISSKGNRKPIAGICSPKQCSLHQRHPS